MSPNNQLSLADIATWLRAEINVAKLPVSRAALFGSVLTDLKTCGDVDLLLVLTEDRSSAMDQIAADIAKMKTNFSRQFLRLLHVTVVDGEDSDKLRSFLAMCGRLQEMLP